MRHYRVDVSGPQAAVATLVAELAAAGAAAVDGSENCCFVVTSEDGLESWKALSMRHPRTVLGVECFDAFEDELLRAVIETGRVTVMARDSVVPSDWGSYDEEDGERLDEDLLRAAAESVAARRHDTKVETLSSGLDTALAMGKALGRFCQRVETTTFEAPMREGHEAVMELAVFALGVSTSSRSCGRVERDFEHALALTQATVHAGRSALWDRPGEADWDDWTLVLIGAASDVVEAACHCRIEAETDRHAVATERYRTPGEDLEAAARSLLTTCLQALALFDGGPEPLP